MKRTLVLGASLNSNRYSYFVISRLISFDYEVLAIGSKKGVINGVQVETEKVQFPDIHTVTLYLNPRRQEDYYNYIISLRPERVIFNPGTENPELYKLLKQHDIYFEAACTLVLLSTNQY